MAEILSISKLDWRDGEGEGEKGRWGGILLCNGLIMGKKCDIEEEGEQLNWYFRVTD